MKPRTKAIALIAGGLLFVAAFFWLLTTHGPLAPVSVQTAGVARADLSPTVFGIGTVEARLAYAVGPIQPGRVLRVMVDQGDLVKAGQLLAEMDPVDMDRRIQGAKSAAARSRQSAQVARAQVAEAESRAKLSRLNHERNLALFRNNVVSSQVLDTSSHEVEASEAALAAARANARAATQDIGRVDADLRGVDSIRDSLLLVSPVDGVIVAREVEPGTTVLAGQAVLRLVSPDSLWVRARVDQSRARGVAVGQPASIALRSAPDIAMPGRVARIELQSDAVTEERIVDVSFDRQAERLFLGELAEVTIQLPGVAGVLTLPTAAIAQRGDQSGVWQLQSGRARFKPVKVGSQGHDGLVQMLSGLTEGESVIVYSSALLEPGVRVREQRVGQP